MHYCLNITAATASSSFFTCTFCAARIEIPFYQLRGTFTKKAELPDFSRKTSSYLGHSNCLVASAEGYFWTPDPFSCTNPIMIIPLPSRYSLLERHILRKLLALKKVSLGHGLKTAFSSSSDLQR